MNQECYVARSAQVAARRLGDEMMMMSASTSTLFTLNETAATICEAADGKTPLHAIVANEVCRRFDVSFEVAMRDAEDLVQKLASHGILVVSDKPITHSAAQPKEVL